MSTIDLTPDTVEAIARRVAELLAPTVERPELIDAAEVARRLGVDRGWVYENAKRLGARRVGDGPPGRLRFDPEQIVEATTPRPFIAPSEPRMRPSRPRKQIVGRAAPGRTSPTEGGPMTPSIDFPTTSPGCDSFIAGERQRRHSHTPSAGLDPILPAGVSGGADRGEALPT